MILLSPIDRPLATAKEGSETSGTEHTGPSEHSYPLFFIILTLQLFICPQEIQTISCPLFDLCNLSQQHGKYCSVLLEMQHALLFHPTLLQEHCYKFYMLFFRRCSNNTFLSLMVVFTQFAKSYSCQQNHPNA